MSAQRTAGRLAHREAGPSDGPVVLLVHGWPESSYMWKDVLPVLGDAGYRAVAPDLIGFGDTPLRRPADWAAHRAALEDFRVALGLDRVVLVVHDWGGLIGLRWACEHPQAIAGLVISDSGFFPDGKWHGLAKGLREPGTGEEIVSALTPDAFAGFLLAASSGFDDDAIAEYGRAFATQEGRFAALDLYRSGNFEELAEHEGALAALRVPTLLLWGEDDPFAPIAGAHRLQREIPHAELEIVPGTGHFVVDEAPAAYAQALVAFLARATMCP